jgi:cellobiose-specific phosphotransferase system component IIA
VNPFDSLSDALPMVDTMVHSEDKLQTSMTMTDRNIVKGNPREPI